MENIFLACFAFGALFTLVSVVLGFAGHGVAHFGHGAGHRFGHGGPLLGHAHVDMAARMSATARTAARTRHGVDRPCRC